MQNAPNEAAFDLLLSDRHCSVWGEALLLHGSDHRPVAVVCVHRRGGAAVGTGQTRRRTTAFSRHTVTAPTQQNHEY